MCLSNLDSMVIPKPKIGYKVFKITRKRVYGLYKGGRIITKKWLLAEQKTLFTTDGYKYDCGFHLFLDRSAAEELAKHKIRSQ